jgi:hypothetical protein
MTLESGARTLDHRGGVCRRDGLARAATVYYLRLMTDRIVPYQEPPLPLAADVLDTSSWCARATSDALTVGMLARGPGGSAAYASIAFGVWDIFYYVFLRLVSDWPRSPFDWDILFLLPLPGGGPCLRPFVLPC